MSEPLSELHKFQRDILTVLNSSPATGQELKMRLEEAYGSDINNGRLYPNLDTLENYGYLERTSVDGRTNEYAITRKGKKILVSDLLWRKELIE